MQLLYPAALSGANDLIPRVLRRTASVGTIGLVPPVEVYLWTQAPTWLLAVGYRLLLKPRWEPPVKVRGA